MAEIDYTIEINPITNYTIELNEQGPQGARGYDGVGISSIDETSSQGLVDTYTITLDDGRTSNFDVTNGFSPTATVTKTGTVAIITITDKDGTTTANVYDGEDSIDDVLVNGESVVTGGVASVIVPTDNNQLTNGAGYINGIDSSDVTTALGYTPYDSSNPSGYTTNTGTVTSVNNVSPVDGNVSLTIPDISSLANQDLSNLTATGKKVIDGQWVNSSLSLAVDITAPTATDIEYDLSSYLPNDGYNYDVIIDGSVQSGTKSGNVCQLAIISSIITELMDITTAQTRTSSFVRSRGSVVIPIGIDRKLIVCAVTSNTGTITVSARGYRRIGTNS